MLEDYARRVLKKELKEEKTEGEAEKEPSDEGIERESFIIALKESAFLPKNGEEDISESVMLKNLEMDADFK